MTAEERLKDKWDEWEGEKELDSTEITDNTIRIGRQCSLWATLKPADIELIVDLVIEKIKESIKL